MSDESLEVVRGSGNLFRDFSYADADLRQAKALLGAQIMRVLHAEGLSTREAEARSGVAQRVFPHPPGQVQPFHPHGRRR